MGSRMTAINSWKSISWSPFLSSSSSVACSSAAESLPRSRPWASSASEMEPSPLRSKVEKAVLHTAFVKHFLRSKLAARNSVKVKSSVEDLSACSSLNMTSAAAWPMPPKSAISCREMKPSPFLSIAWKSSRDAAASFSLMRDAATLRLARLKRFSERYRPKRSSTSAEMSTFLAPEACMTIQGCSSASTGVARSGTDFVSRSITRPTASCETFAQAGELNENLKREDSAWSTLKGN
mmetsp:Transcript_30008/g.54355  ORF Transcript_30008/g.54355 Transcript_30008/m.54355 type:complete len:237 (+) Transcript_30008:24-734(+)